VFLGEGHNYITDTTSSASGEKKSGGGPIRTRDVLLKFSWILLSWTLLGKTTTPRWTCHDMMTWAGVIPRAVAASLI
jgi:hypothetical protein